MAHTVPMNIWVRESNSPGTENCVRIRAQRPCGALKVAYRGGGGVGFGEEGVGVDGTADERTAGGNAH
eukprot:9480269-Pyramimonas_sp.AAC.1